MDGKKKKNKKKKANQSRSTDDVASNAEEVTVPEHDHESAPEQNHDAQALGNADVRDVRVSESDVEQERHKIEVKSVMLQEEVRQLEAEKYSWLQREARLEEKIKHLQNEVDTCIRKEVSLEEKLKDLQIGNNTLVQKGAILEEKVKHLEVSKESLTIAEISIKEMIGRLNEVNAGFQTQVKELEESRNNIVQENKQLMESISVMDLRIQRLEKDATFHGSSTVTMTKHFPVEESLEETHALVDKLDAENSKLFEKVNDLYIERDRNTIVVNHPSTTELSPATTPARLAVSMDFVSENGEKMSESIEKLGYVASIYETIHIDNDDANSSADTGVQPQEQPESDEARGSLEIVQVPLDENQIVAEDSQAINVDENSGVPISDAPLIGAPFRLISFFAKYVSGADLVNKNSPNSG